MDARLTEILRTAWQPLPPEEGHSFSRIVLARLIVFFSVALFWLALLLGMLVWSAVRSS